eukprot:9492490-Pyramimonas_sp.AAC.1
MTPEGLAQDARDSLRYFLSRRFARGTERAEFDAEVAGFAIPTPLPTPPTAGKRPLNFVALAGAHT